MASIIAENVSLAFPLVGSDKKFGDNLKKQMDQKQAAVGGQVLVNEAGNVGILALDNINLNLKDGDRLGIVGVNGSGKSTLLRLLAGIYPPTLGRVTVDGKVAGMYSLNLGINKEASGFENIKLKALMHGLKPKEIKEILPEIVEFSELGEFIHMPVKTYSSGMVMRLMFSTASALRPDILLLDEWISTGDKAFKEKVDERLDEMLNVTPIVVIASHNLKRIQGWATDILHLNKGKGELKRQLEASHAAS